MRSLVATALALLVALASSMPTSSVLASQEQTPEIRPFESAHFGLAGFVKVDGVTVDVLGEGDLALPDRQRASFKFGPFTVEVIMIEDAVYTRTRFEPRWNRQFNPQSAAVGPFSSAELTTLQRDVRFLGREMVGDVPTDHYTTNLEFLKILEPLLPAVDDADTREALRTLKGTVDIWVGAQDRMIRQERMVLGLTLPSFEPEGDPVPATIDLTIAYSALNQPVSIEQPVRNDPSPLRTPRPNVSPVGAPPSSQPPAAPGPGTRAPAPAQVPRR